MEIGIKQFVPTSRCIRSHPCSYGPINLRNSEYFSSLLPEPRSLANGHLLTHSNAPLTFVANIKQERNNV